MRQMYRKAFPFGSFNVLAILHASFHGNAPSGQAADLWRRFLTRSAAAVFQVIGVAKSPLEVAVAPRLH